MFVNFLPPTRSAFLTRPSWPGPGPAKVLFRAAFAVVRTFIGKLLWATRHRLDVLSRSSFFCRYAVFMPKMGPVLLNSLMDLL